MILMTKFLPFLLLHLAILSDASFSPEIVFGANAELGQPVVNICTPESNLFKMSDLLIEPENVSKGGPIKVTLKGDLSENVNSAEISLVVRFMGIKLFDQKLDFCETIKEEESCPVATGEKSWVFSGDIPDSIPSGKYTIALKINDEHSHSLTCANVAISL